MPDVATLPTDTKYNDPRIQAGYLDKLATNINAFNAASRGTIVLKTTRKGGDYDYASFFKNAGGLVVRQDLTSIADVDTKKLTQDEIISVKLNRRIGPVDWARAAFLKAGFDEGAFRVVAGEQAAEDATKDMLDSALLSGRAALAAQATNLFTVAASGTLATASLVDGLAKLGDKADQIILWVMHSKQFFDLVKEQISAAVVGVANYNIATGTPITLNRPVLITDSDSLVVNSGSGSAATTDYHCLGLTADALVVEETEELYVGMYEVSGNEQILRRMQGEFGYNLGVKGFKWDVQNGGKNPLAATLGTGSNWDKVLTSHKALAGVVVKSK